MVSPRPICNSSLRRKIGLHSGRTCHAEHAITTIGKKPEIVSEVHKKAFEWYLLWDNDKHKFENIPKNLDLFNEWMLNPLSFK